MSTPQSHDAVADHDRILRANIARVFGERDARRRLSAIAEIYAEDAVLYEPDAIARGHAAIGEAVDRLLSSLPPEFAFTATGPAVGHHGVARLRWRAGPPNGPAIVTGMDVAHFEGGLIRSLYVFLDPASA